MPKYISKAHLIHNGEIIQPDQEVELTKEQAERLGEKVELIESNEVNLENLGVDELKAIAEERGIEGFNKMKKEDLIKAINAPEQE